MSRQSLAVEKHRIRWAMQDFDSTHFSTYLPPDNRLDSPGLFIGSCAHLPAYILH